MKFQAEIQAAATVYDLPVSLVAGLVSVESNFNPYAWNPEPNYRYFWNVRTNKPFRVVSASEITSSFPPKDFPALSGDPDQEWWGQQASWGLMQVMGALARELDFAGPYLPELTDPATNLNVGCMQLMHLMKWALGNVEQALAAYNGGKGNNEKKPYHNQVYATKVLTAAIQFRST